MMLSLRLALRELRGGVAGFRIFLACLALGVAAIAAAGSTAEAFRQGLASQAREILGGDIAVRREGGRFDKGEMQVLERLGPTARTVDGRLMAQAPSGARRLVELRGVSDTYPLVGKVALDGGGDLKAALAPVDGVAGAVVEPALLDRLGLQIGDQLLVGEIPLRVNGVLQSEPDRLSNGFALGPRVLTRLDAVQASGALESGPPFDETIRLALKPGEPLRPIAKSVREALGGQGLRVRDREDAAPGLRWLIDQLEYFLAFVGLASLIAGGLGVFGAVSAFLESRRPSIAVLKALGASGALARNTYLLLILLLAGAGIGLGVVIGAVTPLLLGRFLAEELPIPALFRLYPEPLWRAAAFGALAAAAFSLPPLARARATPPASLLRRDLGSRGLVAVETLIALAAGAALVWLAVSTAPNELTAVSLIGGVAAAFATLWLIGLLTAWCAGKLRGPTRGALRLALANLAGPRSAARTAAPAIGLGVALLAVVVLIQSSLLRQVTEVAPRSAPALVFTDIPHDRVNEFDSVVRNAFGVELTAENYLRMPFVTGRITALRGAPVDRGQIADGERWAFDNDITMSVLRAEPPNAGVTAGRWWDAAYSGPPLVAMEADAAAGAGLRVGDAITVSVLGREIDARIAVLRQVELGQFGPSFPIILNPSALEGANLLHVAIAKATPRQEEAASRALGGRFPDVNVISVREQLEAAGSVFERLSFAIRGAASVAGLAGVLVMAGAIASRAQARAQEAATLRVLGASRRQVLAAYVLEYGLIGVLSALAGLAFGYLAAWPVVTQVFKTDWSVDWTGVAALVGGVAVLAAMGGGVAAAYALAKRPSSALRGP